MPKLWALLLGMLILFITQALAFVQTNGQFLWPWFAKNTLVVALVMGSTIGFGFIISTGYITQYFDTIWPARILSFSLGVLSFTFLAWWLKGEAITMKTIVCLILALSITLIQIFWNEELPSRTDDGATRVERTNLDN